MVGLGSCGAEKGVDQLTPGTSREKEKFNTLEEEINLMQSYYLPCKCRYRDGYLQSMQKQNTAMHWQRPSTTNPFQVEAWSGVTGPIKWKRNDLYLRF